MEDTNFIFVKPEPLFPVDSMDGVEVVLSDILACLTEGQEAATVVAQQSNASRVTVDRNHAKETYMTHFQNSRPEQQAAIVCKLVELMVPEHPAAAQVASFAGYMLTKSASFHKQLLASPHTFLHMASLMQFGNNPAAAAAKALYAMTVNRLEGRDVTAACSKAVQTPGIIQGLVLMLAQGNKSSVAACVLQNLSAHFIAGSTELATLSAQITYMPAAISSLRHLLCSRANAASDTSKMFAHQAPTAAAFMLGVVCEQGPAMCKLIADTPAVVRNLVQLLHPGAGAAAAEAAWALGNLAVHSDLATFVSLTQGPDNIVGSLVAALQLGGIVSEAAAKSLAKMASSERPEFKSSTAMAVVAAPAAVQALLQLLGRGEAVTAAAFTVLTVITKGSSHEALLYITTELGAIEGLISIVRRGAAALAVPNERSAAAVAVFVLHQLLFLRQGVRPQLCGLILTVAGGDILALISSIAEKCLTTRPQVAQAATEIVAELLRHAAVTHRASIANTPGIAAALGTCLLPSSSSVNQQTVQAVAVTVATAAAAGDSLMQLATNQYLVQHGSLLQDADLVAHRLEKLKLHLAGIAPVLQYLLQLPAFQDLSALQLTALAVQQLHWQQQLQQQQQNGQIGQSQQCPTSSSSGGSSQTRPACSSDLQGTSRAHLHTAGHKSMTKIQRPDSQPAAHAPGAQPLHYPAVHRPHWTNMHAQPTEADSVLFLQYQRHKARCKTQQQNMVAAENQIGSVELLQVDPDTPTSAYSVIDPADECASAADETVDSTGDDTVVRGGAGDAGSGSVGGGEACILSSECADAVWAEVAAAALRTHTTWLAGEQQGSSTHDLQASKSPPAAGGGSGPTAGVAAVPASVVGRRSVGAVAMSGVTCQHQVRQQSEVQQVAAAEYGDTMAGVAAGHMTVFAAQGAEEMKERVVLGPTDSNQMDPPFANQQTNKRMRSSTQL